jgi:ferritin-like metal-binding protein YciE
MAKQVGGLRQLLLEELQDLFDAEKQLVRALPKMAKSATDDELEFALREHLDVTRGQVQRLEQIFQGMDMRARSKPCRGMKGIVEEGQEVMGEERDQAILDSAIAASGRKVEHYEMMGYEAARSIAQQLGMRDAAQLLQQTLKEEMQADRQLAQISKRLLKQTGRQTKSSRGRGSAR